MLVYARTARTASKSAPRQQRTAQAVARLRGLYGPSMRFWLAGNKDQGSVGQIASIAQDISGNNITVSQTSSSKRPIKSLVSDVYGWTFDGVDDQLDTGAINLSNTKAVSVFSVNRQTATASGILLEIGNQTGLVNGGIQYYRDNLGRLHGNSYSGNGLYGYNEKYISTNFNSWVVHTLTVDRNLSAANETTLYLGTSTPAATTVVLTDLTANFESRAGQIGNWAFSSLPFGGQIAQILVLNICCTAAQQAEIANLLTEVAGI